MKYLLACVVLALKSFFSSCYECSSLHRKRPKGKERCAKPVAGKILASVRVFLYSKIVHINPFLKAMFQAERFNSESDVSTDFI